MIYVWGSGVCLSLLTSSLLSFNLDMFIGGNGQLGLGNTDDYSTPQLMCVEPVGIKHLEVANKTYVFCSPL